MNTENWNPVIETERLFLRALTDNDAHALYLIRSSDENLKFVDMKRYADEVRAQKFIKALIKDIEFKEVCYWGLVAKEKQSVVGTVCLWNFSEDGKIGEIGYELLPAHQGKGYMHEALQAVVQYGFETLELQWLWAITHRLHVKSIALLEKKDFVCRGIATEAEPEIEEGPDMMLYVLRNPKSV